MRIQREQGEQAIRNVCTTLKIKMYVVKPGRISWFGGSVYFHPSYLHLLLLLTTCVLWYRLNTAELGFLAEYATVVKPVAMALNLLQGESSVHMGFLLPTLYQLQDKLKKLESSCKVCQPLLKALHGGILKRFGEVMKEPELIAAAILLPKFRTAWTTNQSIFTTGNVSVNSCANLNVINLTLR